LEKLKNRTWKWGKIFTIFKQKDLNVEYKRIQPQIHRGIPLQNRDTNTQVMESESAVLGSNSESHWKNGNIEHENGLKQILNSMCNI